MPKDNIMGEMDLPNWSGVVGIGKRVMLGYLGEEGEYIADERGVGNFLYGKPLLIALLNTESQKL